MHGSVNLNELKEAKLSRWSTPIVDQSSRIPALRILKQREETKGPERRWDARGLLVGSVALRPLLATSSFGVAVAQVNRYSSPTYGDGRSVVTDGHCFLSLGEDVHSMTYRKIQLG